MTLWIILTTIAAIVAVGAAVPFLRRGGSHEVRSETAKSSTVFRDQLRQIENELKAGIINEDEAEATRAEVARRLVLAERDEKAASETTLTAERSFAAVAITGAIALGSTVLYASIGEPERIPSARPTGNMITGSVDRPPARHPAITDSAALGGSGASSASGAGAASGGGQQSGLPTVDAMIERLSKRLRVNPDDAEGWRMLGWSYASQGRYNESATAYDEAIKRQPENSELYATLGEILVRAGNGAVTDKAAKAFEATLTRDKLNPRARYFLGLKKAQAGDRKQAIADWIAMLKDASPGDPWVPDLRQHVEALAAEMNLDVSADLAQVASATAPATSQPAATPQPRSGTSAPGILDELQKGGGATSSAPAGSTVGAAQVTAAETPEDQYAMIRGMVDGLAARLESEPRDAQGWARLIRSRVVLGETDKARVALAKAREVFSDTPEVLDSIASLARQLALEP